jgi:beta-glucanase (GH16 family)
MLPTTLWPSRLSPAPSQRLEWFEGCLVASSIHKGIAIITVSLLAFAIGAAAGLARSSGLPVTSDGFGVPIPVGSIPGWHQVFTDDFNGTHLDTSKWDAFEGEPGGSGSGWTGWWDPSHVVVHNGMAQLRTYRDIRFHDRWVSGGISNNKATEFQYGKYEVRFRVDAGYGVNVVLLVWPDDNSWPPEIDFAENGGADRERAEMSATLHYGSGNDFTQHLAHDDFTRWHTIGVEWSPGRIAYTKDGAVWATITGSTVPRNVMHFAAAEMAGVAGDRYHPAPDWSTPTEVDLQIDWVAIYALGSRS